MRSIPDVIPANSYAFGHIHGDSDSYYKLKGYIPFKGTSIGMIRAHEALMNSMNRGLVSRISQFARALFELIPVVNLILIPIDIVATIGLKTSNAISDLMDNIYGSPYKSGIAK